MFGSCHQEEEIRIRIPEKGMDFVYSITRGEEVIESGVIPPIGHPRADLSVPPFHCWELFPTAAFDDPQIGSNPGAVRAFRAALYGSDER